MSPAMGPRRSVDFQLVFVAAGLGGSSLRPGRADSDFSALLVLAGLESVETLPEPSFLRPLPVLIVVYITRSRLHKVLGQNSRARAVPLLRT